MTLSAESLEDTEQVQVKMCSAVRREALEWAVIRQPFGIARSADGERIGELWPAQQAELGTDVFRLE